jgi:N-acetylmuramoyl-L-alanine amidase
VSKLHKKYAASMKRALFTFGILFVFVWPAAFAIAQVDNTIRKVVIDPGHGGKDPGALGKHSREKDITLSVALKTGDYISTNCQNIEVSYTRQTDEFVELHRRAEIANESGADLFISIHCNSNKSPQPYGIETYVMGLHKSQDNLDVAKTENAAIYYEEDYATLYEGFNPNSDEDYIILNMFQNANIDQSISLSSKVQSYFKNGLNRHDRGVKQAGFWVLYKTTMPGILIELGFLSNAEEEKFLLSQEGQDQMAQAIYMAFAEFKKEYEDENRDLKPVVVKKEEPVLPQVYYRVQFASYKKEKTLDFRKFRGLEDIRVYFHENMYKYTAGNELTLQDAQNLKNQLTEKGYKDVFIVAFVNEERITLEEAHQYSVKSELP